MVLATDISKHFDNIMVFKGKLRSPKFPDDSKEMEDKQLIMNYLLYAADHAIPCKPTLTYFKWMADMMEEFYQQGDVERKLGYEVHNFFDRAQCNPFIF